MEKIEGVKDDRNARDYLNPAIPVSEPDRLAALALKRQQESDESAPTLEDFQKAHQEKLDFYAEEQKEDEEGEEGVKQDVLNPKAPQSAEQLQSRGLLDSQATSVTMPGAKQAGEEAAMHNAKQAQKSERSLVDKVLHPSKK